jgi:heme-binding protein
VPDNAAPQPAARAPRRRRVLRGIGWLALALLAVLLVIQLVPYGRDHSSPAPTKQVRLATAGQRELFREACQDCHSYQTQWLWYTNIAPISWLVQSDVDGGREHLNLSTWDQPQAELGDVVEQIQSGEMPPLKYWISPYHWNARLSDKDKRELVAGFRQLYATTPPPGGGGG